MEENISGCVYFIESGENGPIKIGLLKNNSPDDIKLKMSKIQMCNPFLMTLLCIIPGDRALEKYYHEKFSKFNIRGEWFARNEELILLISQQKYLGITHLNCNESLNIPKKARSLVRKENKFKKETCQICGKSAYEQKFKDGNHKNFNPDNLVIVCRRCSMQIDGRLDKLVEAGKNQKNKIRFMAHECIICKKMIDKPGGSRKGRCRNCYAYRERNGFDKNTVSE